ncbi:hypothetical protein BC832DRAFT_596051 [Gaertneriomyces semiglobifer]|nr:hypothetical protein BC832DRAFT_596051 [Gaertneriomyces semiglobifer]
MTSLQIKPFSIQEFVGTKKLPRDAIVEIMIIHLCDKCAYLKEKYILSLEIAAAAADHLYPGARTRKTVRIAAESDDNQEVKNVPDFSHIDASIKNIEKLLDHQFSLLMRLAWRHDLIAGAETSALIRTVMETDLISSPTNGTGGAPLEQDNSTSVEPSQASTIDLKEQFVPTRFRNATLKSAGHVILLPFLPFDPHVIYAFMDSITLLRQ